jgi:hypothetical protein
LPDLPCWSRDEVSANYFNGRVYGDLNDDEKKQVDDTFSNVMSYHRFDTPQHQAHSLQTEDQLDKFADTASWVRTAARSGIVVFVDDGAGAVQNGTSELPYDTVAEGLNQAGFSSGNIVLIRPGNYPENLRISDPVTLRVPRTGTARIGSTGMVSR